MKVVVASTNPVKIIASRTGFESMFPDRDFQFEGVSAPSDVSDQPMSDAETYKGACNRAENARFIRPGADFWVGIEGGIAEREGEMEAFAWIVIIDKDRKGAAKTSSFFLPPEVSRLIRAGFELGQADDRVFGTVDSKEKNGAVGLLTADVITREGLYRPAIILALIPFKQTELYPLT